MREVWEPQGLRWRGDYGKIGCWGKLIEMLGAADKIRFMYASVYVQNIAEHRRYLILGPNVILFY